MLQQTYIDRLITTALDEDIHYIDVTTDNLLDDSHTSEAYYLAKDSGVLCGIDIAKRVFELVGGNFSMDIRIHDGEQVKKGDIIATMTGSTKTLLKGERTALNIAAHERHCHGDPPVRGAGCRNECTDHRHPKDPAGTASAAKVCRDGGRRQEPPL